MGKATWQPKWWTEEHASTWARTKEALKRDWEQTKADLHLGGRDLDQDVDDTVKQAAGKDVIPPAGAPNAPGGTKATGSGDGGGRGRDVTWDDAEEPLMYGVGARHQYGSQYADWNDDLESRLRTDWDASHDGAGGGASGAVHRKWHEVKSLVRRGYDRARH